MSATQTHLEHLLADAVATLRRGELVVLPTETVYGLGADADNPTAVAKIFTLKGRPSPAPINSSHRRRRMPRRMGARNSRRRLPARRKILARPTYACAKTQRTACSAIQSPAASIPSASASPAHPLAYALLHSFGGGGVAAPSANRFGAKCRRPPRSTSAKNLAPIRLSSSTAARAKSASNRRSSI